MDLMKVVKSGLGVPIGLLLLLMMIMLPLPPFLLDLFFTFNITLSILILLAGVYCLRPLDFAVFPTVLLFATLLRLALNVASTRVVLLYGQNGPGAAGDVIRSFGEVVIGSSYAVGLVVFAILVIINFIVVTKGAGRIAEVSARFTLDAMPGKQMAIDADLNAGIIDQEEAGRRRQEVAQESDFYGAMDGASKFVRGDAIAGILILIINVIGGIVIGTLQHGMSIMDALQVYALLTIGDGLVAQIPSLLLAVASALMVSRVSKSETVESQLSSQIFRSSKPFLITGIILAGLGAIPGMPHLPFLGLGGALLGAYYYFENKKELEKKQQAMQSQQQAVAKPKAEEAAEKEKEGKELDWEDVPPVDILGLEIGYRLIPLVDKAQSGELMSRIKGVRKKLSQELGFLIPSVHIKDNLDMPPNGYRISLLGVVVAEDKVYPDKELAINPGQVFGELQGTNVKDPAFNLDAVWVNQNEHEHAQTLGYTVVDASTVVATHLSQVIQNHSYQLLGHEEVQKLLDILKVNSPKLVDDLVPKTLSLSMIVKILQNLLKEKVSIKDLRTIAITLAEEALHTQDPEELTALVRVNLGAMITQQINGISQELPVITLSPKLEQILQKSIQGKGPDSFMVEPGLAEKLQTSLQSIFEQQESVGQPSVLLTATSIRNAMSKFVRSFIPMMSVLAYPEVPENKLIKIVNTVGE